MSTVQSDVNAAPAGSTVPVSGAQTTLDLAKALTVKGDGTAVLDGGNAPSKNVVRVHGAGATLDTLTVQGSGIVNGEMNAAVMVDGSGNNTTLTSIKTRASAFGVRTYGTTGIVLTDYDSRDCAVGLGIWLKGGVRLDRFYISATRMIVDDPTPGNDNGANGVQIEYTDGTLIELLNGTFENCRSASHDYGKDGGAVELFGASNVTVRNVIARGCVNFSETGTNPGHPDCSGILYDTCQVVGRDGTDHTQDGSITCNGIIMRNLVNSKVTGTLFDRVDWWCFDWTLGSKFDGSGCSNVEIAHNTFILRDGDDKVHAMPQGVPKGCTSHDNIVVANPSANFGSFKGRNYPATPAGLAAWQADTGTEQGTVLYTPDQWAAHNAPPVVIPPVVVPPVPPYVSQLPGLDAHIASFKAQMDDRLPSSNSKNRAARAAWNDTAKYMRAALISAEARINA